MTSNVWQNFAKQCCWKTSNTFLPVSDKNVWRAIVCQTFAICSTRNNFDRLAMVQTLLCKQNWFCNAFETLQAHFCLSQIKMFDEQLFVKDLRFASQETILTVGHVAKHCSSKKFYRTKEKCVWIFSQTLRYEFCLCLSSNVFRKALDKRSIIVCQTLPNVCRTAKHSLKSKSTWDCGFSCKINNYFFIF